MRSFIQKHNLFCLCLNLLVPFVAPDNPFVECCALKLMDSNMQAAIEINRPINGGTYRALVARLCTTDPVYVQIWTRNPNGVSGTEYKLKWQIMITPTINQTSQSSTVITFPGPLVITSSDRLGLYNPSSTNMKYAIPYTYDPSIANYALDLTSDTFLDPTQLNIGFTTEITMDQPVSRSFVNYLKFCQSATQCPALPADQPQTVSPAYSNYITIPASCCSSKVSCDSGSGISSALTDQNRQIMSLQDAIASLQEQLNSLLNSQTQTGTCPSGFVPGVYGVGFCYKIINTMQQEAQAALMCSQEGGSKLVDIQSEAEDKFLKNFVMNVSISAGRTGIVSFWTSGMYNLDNRNWYWTNQASSSKEVFGVYRNWNQGLEPAATSKLDVCCKFTVNPQLGTDYWEKATCIDTNYYICKIPKKCF